MNKFLFLLSTCLIVLVLAGCNPNNNDICDACAPVNSLEAFVENNSEFTISDQLIACAAGGQMTFLQDSAYKISVFFLPIEGATDFRFFETGSESDDASDYGLYQEKGLEAIPIFNSFLYYFKHLAIAEDLWCRVTYKVGQTLHISNPIRLKYTTKPTQYAPELITVDQSQNLNPVFTWQDGIVPENEIYFQVVSDQQNNLLSGTYTTDQQFQFYNLSNVVLNINDVTPPPALLPSSLYRFTLMGVSEDNWVNLIGDKIFFTN